MLNFTVGPVQVYENIRQMGAAQIPYFRTPEFSKIMKENEQLFLKALHAPPNARAIFMTGSGTCSMEAAVMNIFNINDKVMVINGGSFGERFSKICSIHGISHKNIYLETGETLKESHLRQYEHKGYTGLLVNIHETSTGVLYNINLISDFCIRNNMILVIDAISSFIADPIDMEEIRADAIIVGSQKALALPPGLSVIALSERAIRRIYNNTPKSIYLNLQIALKNGERGQTPFTPAVGLLLQMNKRLKYIDEVGIEYEIDKIRKLANDFRSKIKKLPFDIASKSMSNAMTPLFTKNVSAYKIFEILKTEYNIWVCPSGGNLMEELLRVGHIGDLTIEDNDILIAAFEDIKRRGII